MLMVTGTAGAKTQRFTSKKERAGKVVFKVKRLSGKKIRSATVKRGGRKRKLSAKYVAKAAKTGIVLARAPKMSKKGSGVVASRRGRKRRKATLVVVTGPTKKTASPEVCGLAEKLVFRAGQWPGGCWRPYADSSPFNRAIPSSPKLLSNSSGIVRRVTKFGKPQQLEAGQAGSEDDWYHPAYYSQPDDPQFTLHCTEEWGECEVEGMKVRIPDRAKPAAGGDAHLTVVDQASGWEYDLWSVSSKPKGGGTLRFAWGGRTRIDGDGLDSDATAAKFGGMAGMIRGPEIQAGEIDHAIFMTAYCDSGEHVYPAKKSGRACTDIGLSNSDAPPMGAHFQLTMSESQIDGLDVPAWKKTILRAMAKYGMYFGDTGGSSWAIQSESGQTYTSFGHEDKMVEAAKKAGVPSYDGNYIFDVADGVDWGKYLRVVDPCVANGTCS